MKDQLTQSLSVLVRLKTVISSSNQKEKHDNATFLQILITFCIQSEFHEHAAYLVDSLWDVAGSELRDWDTMTAFLLQEAGKEQDKTVHMTNNPGTGQETYHDPLHPFTSTATVQGTLPRFT
uniref:Cohesin subunit SCC3/SA HEAT-repeats domain-containing protein n=1 Tax=Mastacembelus armatus TaxID=205130 RepID=A0A3Q3MK65_9TELE